MIVQAVKYNEGTRIPELENITLIEANYGSMGTTYGWGKVINYRTVQKIAERPWNIGRIIWSIKE
jgi:hypothetical protein